MPTNDREPNQENIERSNEYLKGGKGRKDDVRGSRLYPTSSPDAPRDAEIRTEGNLAKHKGAADKRPKPFKRVI